MLKADLNSSLAVAALLRSTGIAVLIAALEDLEILEGDSSHSLLMQMLGIFSRFGPHRLSCLVHKHGLSFKTRGMPNKKGDQSAYLLLLLNI